jgi:vacuolar-type H+-ATPase subunit I/STV1
MAWRTDWYRDGMNSCRCFDTRVVTSLDVIMNKRHLSSFRRSPLGKFACLAVLAFMLVLVALFAAPAFKSGSLALACLAPVAFLRKEASEEGEGGGGGEKTPTAAEALAAVEDPTMTMSQRLKVAAQALRGIDPTNQLAALQSQLQTAKESLAAKETELAGVQAELGTTKQRVAALEGDVKTLEQSNADLQAKEQDLEKRAAEKAKEQVRSVGIKAAKLPKSTDDEKVPATGAKAALEAFQAEKDPDKKAALYQTYRAEAAKEAGAKA